MNKNHKLFLSITVFIAIIYLCLKIFIYHQNLKTINTLYTLLSEKSELLAIVPQQREITVINFLETSSEVFESAIFNIPYPSNSTQWSSALTVNSIDEATSKSISIFRNPETTIKTLYDFSSDFDGYTKILNTTLNEIELHEISTRERHKSLILGLLKTPLLEPNTDLYTFSTNEITGFQFGNPSVQASVSVYVFDKNNGDLKYTIMTTNLSQEEIDFILHSFTFKK